MTTHRELTASAQAVLHLLAGVEGEVALLKIRDLTTGLHCRGWHLVIPYLFVAKVKD